MARKSLVQRLLKKKLKGAMRDILEEAIQLSKEYDLNPSIELDVENKGIFIAFDPQRKKL